MRHMVERSVLVLARSATSLYPTSRAVREDGRGPEACADATGDKGGANSGPGTEAPLSAAPHWRFKRSLRSIERVGNVQSADGHGSPKSCRAGPCAPDRDSAVCTSSHRSENVPILPQLRRVGDSISVERA